MHISGNTGTTALSGMDIQNTDIETLLMAVQQERTRLLDNQLKGQLEHVNDQNKAMEQKNSSISNAQKKIIELDTSNADLNTEIAELTVLKDRLNASKCPDPDGWYGLAWAENDDGPASYKMLEEVKAAGCTIPTGSDRPRNIDGNHTLDAKGKVVADWVSQIEAKIEAKQNQIQENTEQKKTLDNEIDTLKRDVDALSSTQQLEMLRLQSLSNKRNESFDVMTNFIKKMQDNRSSIISNMR